MYDTIVQYVGLVMLKHNFSYYEIPMIVSVRTFSAMKKCLWNMKIPGKYVGNGIRGRP